MASRCPGRGGTGGASPLEERAGRAHARPHDIAMIYSALGETGEAFGWLRAAYRGRLSLLVLPEPDPRFDSLRSDPRFTNLLSRIADADARSPARGAPA